MVDSTGFPCFHRGRLCSLFEDRDMLRRNDRAIYRNVHTIWGALSACEEYPLEFSAALALQPKVEARPVGRWAPEQGLHFGE